jgi:hypothetical protein
MEEYLLDEHRRDIKHEVSHIRLQELTLNKKVIGPNWFTSVMQNLGQWLIALGERMVKRYEVPVNRCQPSKQSYAH